MMIRREQIAVFEKIAEQQFEDGTLEHLQRIAPQHCRLLGEAGTRRMIRLGWSRAKGYGLITEQGVRLYTGLMLMLGSGFDKDPQLPWAAEILKDTGTPLAKSSRLYTEALDYFALVGGYRGEHVHQALLRARQMGIGALPKSAAEFSEQLTELLKDLFPQKCEYLGEAGLRQLIEHGSVSASRRGLAGPQGMALFVCLMFMLGSRFDDDPQFPWAAAALQASDIPDEGDRVDQLYDGAMTHLERWLEAPEEKSHVL